MPEAHRRYSATKSADADVTSTRSNAYEAASNSKKEAPTWYLVDVAFVKKFKHFLSLDEVKKIKGLEGMLLLQKGSRLSVQPVSQKHWNVLEEKGMA